MANGEIVHLKQASESFRPNDPLAEGSERALRGTYFGDIPAEVNPEYTADLLRISEAFAAPLANLFAFVEQGHQPCSFVPQKQLALHANPLFWQYGLLAFVAGCCAFNNRHRRQNASAAKAAPSKQEEPSEKDVDALTFMQAVMHVFRARNGARGADATHQ